MSYLLDDELMELKSTEDQKAQFTRQLCHESRDMSRVRELMLYAEAYYENGFYSLNAPPVMEDGRLVAAKGPRVKGWTSTCLPPQALYHLMRGKIDGVPENLSILTGWPSKGLVAIDVDIPAAQAAWPIVQKHIGLYTPMTSGRESEPNRGHFFYRCPGLGKGHAYRWHAVGTFIDLLSDTGCVMAPPSIHPKTGEKVEWRCDVVEGLRPPQVAPITLLKACGWTSASALVGCVMAKQQSEHDEIAAAFNAIMRECELPHETRNSLLSAAYRGASACFGDSSRLPKPSALPTPSPIETYFGPLVIAKIRAWLNPSFLLPN